MEWNDSSGLAVVLHGGESLIFWKTLRHSFVKALPVPPRSRGAMKLSCVDVMEWLVQFYVWIDVCMYNIIVQRFTSGTAEFLTSHFLNI